MTDSPLFKTLQPLVLASGSPRRRRMLAELGLDFTLAVADIAEVAQPGESPADFARRLAGEKAAAVALRHPASWVLAADTVVARAGRILGKPADPEDAAAMLAALSGHWHTVWTGFALRRGRDVLAEVVATEVRFAELSEPLIRAYVATGEPLDKAGAYGIQGRGGLLVREIRGSYSNVVGLPLAEVIAALTARAIISPASL
ncbi:Maf family protein [Desulfurivibrio sp. C05AmB]|uniref:Maf family protein n=1 Tax=Desulfurivibrio sp. C05AmB TaxID=3374371 RepID=UPI00376EF9B1